MFKILTFSHNKDISLEVKALDSFEEIKEMILVKDRFKRKDYGLNALDAQQKNIVNNFLLSFLSSSNVFVSNSPFGRSGTGMVQITDTDCEEVLKENAKENHVMFVKNIQVYYIEEAIEITYNYWSADTEFFSTIMAAAKIAIRHKIIDMFILDGL